MPVMDYWTCWPRLRRSVHGKIGVDVPSVVPRLGGQDYVLGVSC